MVVASNADFMNVSAFLLVGGILSPKPLVSVPSELAAHPSDALIHFDVLVIERIIRVGSPSRWLLDWRYQLLSEDRVFT